MQLMTLSEAAQYLALPKGAARKVLEGLPCIDFGRGRGRGKRWLLSDIDEYLFSKRSAPKPTNSRPASKSLADYSPADFMRILSGPPTRQ